MTLHSALPVAAPLVCEGKLAEARARARVCRRVMVRDAARIMGQTDATPFMENADAYFASISGRVEDEADLGDAEKFDEGDEIIRMAMAR